jgi:hypothetical protein
MRERSDGIRNRLASVNKKIEDVRTIAEGVETPFWRAYKSKLEEKLAAFDFRLDNFERFDQEKRTVTLAQRQVLKLCLSMPEDLASQMERLLNLAEKLREALKNGK